MNKPFGNRGTIKNFPFKDLNETLYVQDGIEIEIKEGNLSVGVDNQRKLQEANEIALLILSVWGFRQNLQTTVTFDHNWITNKDGSKNLYLSLGGTTTSQGRVSIEKITNQANITGKSRIISQKMYDSASFTNDLNLVVKALSNEALRNALAYYNNEVIEDDLPLYGIYKSIETITKYLEKNGTENGREELGTLAGKNKKFVGDIMETAQKLTRHHEDKNARSLLSETECIERAKLLIEAFANSL